MGIVFSCSFVWGESILFACFQCMTFSFVNYFSCSINGLILNLYQQTLCLGSISFVRINAANLKQFSKNGRIYSIISFYEDTDIDDIGADGYIQSFQPAECVFIADDTGLLVS